MKRASASTAQTACETPAERLVTPAALEADPGLAAVSAECGPPDEHKRQLDAELVHVVRLAALGRMLAGIAHEINHPLFAIQNYTRAAIAALTQPETLDRDKVLEWTRQLALEADRARTIICRLLNFSRKATPCAIPQDVCQIVQEALELVGPQAALREVAVELRLDPQARSIYADRIQIEQVLVNLLQNACEAIDLSVSAMRKIAVQTRREKGYVHFSVSDTGGGLPAIDQADLFEPFFTTKPEGAGIGLAVSRSIVEGVRGRLWAEPNTPVGAVFHFTVPSGPEVIDE